MATFAAATVSTSNPDGSDSYGLTPFIATRPLTSVSLIAARLKVTIRSTLAAWLLVIVAIPIALKLSGTLPLVGDWTRNLIEAAGTPRAIAIVLLGFTGLLASTWKQLVQSLYIGVSGREWAVKASVFLTLSLLAVLLPFGHWVLRKRAVMAAWWNALPWIAAVLVCVKISTAAWIAMRLHDSRLLRGRTLVLGAVCWDVAVLALYGLLVWIIPWRDSPRRRWHSRGTGTADPFEDDHVKQQEQSHWRGADYPQPAGGACPERGGLVSRPESQQRLFRLFGREAAVPAFRSAQLRPQQSNATRHQHARRGRMAGPADGHE
jgi:hypothetical protein